MLFALEPAAQDLDLAGLADLAAVCRLRRVPRRVDVGAWTLAGAGFLVTAGLEALAVDAAGAADLVRGSGLLSPDPEPVRIVGVFLHPLLDPVEDESGLRRRTSLGRDDVACVLVHAAPRNFLPRTVPLGFNLSVAAEPADEPAGLLDAESVLPSRTGPAAVGRGVRILGENVGR